MVKTGSRSSTFKVYRLDELADVYIVSKISTIRYRKTKVNFIKRYFSFI